ncbi:enoyl-CoA hydratase/isomerase family protein [Rhodoligotrophos defluvii]|uniref:enoyl-CoA hydratase/isomerase family protein n=1 Tax=Rhodoligotrophos defluvii TaxID=2561934 RepID=UPI0010C9DBEB|nr:enoyl-CoA hydratase/isomerase family protein [Rhodoligotrophos defluvii]
MRKDYADQRASVLRELDGLRYEVDTENKIGWLILDRPPLNIVSYRGRQQINAIMEAFSEDDDVRVVVIRGANGVYTSGGDVKAFPQIPLDRMSDLAWNISAPERCPKPVICAIEKYAMGVGFELAMACDIRIATKDSVVALPEVTLGQIPGSGGSQRVARIAGTTRAFEMMAFGRRVPAPEALQWGLLTRVVEDAAALEKEIMDMVAKLRAGSPLALRTIKRVLATTYDTSLSVGLELEGHAYEKLRRTEDYQEGITAFTEKRKANFKETI